MSIYVFLGPSLPVEQAREVIDATFLPPAAMGDVQALMNGPTLPQAICIIDGFFEQKPAVWHKELLYAMSRGVAVWGASSMGALRGAELADFGMRGVGRIFEGYRSAAIEADDEVTVVHAPAESQYRPLSEALANIRFALEDALQAGLIDADARQTLFAIAQATPYPERAWPRVLEQALEKVADEQLQRLKTFLKEKKPNQKRDDALECLRAVKAWAADGATTTPVTFDFEPTHYWRRMNAQVSRVAGSEHTVALVQHLSLFSSSPDALRRGGLLAALAVREAGRMGLLSHQPEAQHERLIAFRKQHGLQSADTLKRWMETNELTPNELKAMVDSEAAIEALLRTGREEWSRGLLNEARRTGEYARGLNSLKAQRQAVAKSGINELTPEAAGATLKQVHDWYVHAQGTAAVDLNKKPVDLGFERDEELTRELVRGFIAANKR